MHPEIPPLATDKIAFDAKNLKKQLLALNKKIMFLFGLGHPHTGLGAESAVFLTMGQILMAQSWQRSVGLWLVLGTPREA